ncbi:sugar hydrolase, partial [Kribbella antibiotica]
MRKRLHLPAIVAALVTAAGLLTAGSTTPAAAVPATIPLQISNNSGRGDALYIYNLGTNLSTGQQGWADAAGNFHAWPAGGNPPTP